MNGEKYYQNIGNIMVGRGNESKNMGISGKIINNGEKYSEYIGNTMVGRGIESKSIGKQ